MERAPDLARISCENRWCFAHQRVAKLSGHLVNTLVFKLCYLTNATIEGEYQCTSLYIHNSGDSYLYEFEAYKL